MGSNTFWPEIFPVFLITSGIVFNVKFWIFSFKCYLSSLVRTLFSLKVVLFFFILSIYREHSRIWNTFPTSKTELFVTIAIYKVIFRRLMILYTLYSSMSVFICISSLPAPFCSRWFHLQASEMVLFVTITIPNIAFY